MRMKMWPLAATLALAAAAPALAADPIGYVAGDGVNTVAVTHKAPLPVGGAMAAISVAQTVTASSAYVSGNAVGGLITVAGAFNSDAGAGLLQSVAVTTKSTQSTQMDAIIFNANPSGSSCIDKTAFSVATADLGKVVAVIHITDWTNLGTPDVGQAQTIAAPVSVGSGMTAFYACLVTRSTPTYSSTSDVGVTFNVLLF